MSGGCSKLFTTQWLMVLGDIERKGWIESADMIANVFTWEMDDDLFPDSA